MGVTICPCRTQLRVTCTNHATDKRCVKQPHGTVAALSNRIHDGLGRYAGGPRMQGCAPG